MSSIIIVGGGIIGLLTAYELDKAGLQVTLIDRQQLGQESSWAGGGIISPLYPWRYPDEVTRLAGLSQQLYPELIEQLQKATGKDAEFLHSSMLILGDYENEHPLAWSERHRVNMQAVETDEIQQLEPQLSTHFNRGFWFADVHQARNPRLVVLVKEYLKKTQVDILENTPVTEILVKNGKATGIKTAAQSIFADQILVASGAWTSQLLKPTGADMGIKPVKGQMLLLKGPVDTVRPIILSEDRYIIPRKDGRILVGSTTEDCGFNKETSKQVREQLFDYAARTIPALKSFPIERHWSGLRPGSELGIPVIGQHPEIDNLFINSGHYRNGLVMAPASARLMSEIVLNKPTCLDKNDYTPCDRNHNKN